MVNYEGVRVLILEGYARQCLPFMRSFKKHGCEVTILCNSKFDIGYASRYADHKIVGPCSPDNYEKSESYICNLIKTDQYDLILPLVDFSARILSENKEELSKHARICSNNVAVFLQSQDKLSVMRACTEQGIPCPQTLLEVTSVDDIVTSKLSYPIVIKPRRGCGARGFQRFDSEEDLRKHYDCYNREQLSDCVVQEYITQTDSNLSVTLFIDRDGVVKTAFTYVSRRWFPLKGGTGTFNELVDRPDAVEVAKKAVSLFQLRGIVGVDLIDDPRDHLPKIIEINPRILACAQIGFEGGVDLAELILENEFGREVSERKVNKVGICVRMSQIDFLWFLKSPDRWRAKPSWFQLKNVKDQTFSWKDPLPWFAFALSGVLKYKREMEQRR